MSDWVARAADRVREWSARFARLDGHGGTVHVAEGVPLMLSDLEALLDGRAEPRHHSAEVRADLALALGLLAELRDEGGCLLNHAGVCHAHWRFSPDGRWSCPHQRAARLLDKYADQARDD